MKIQLAERTKAELSPIRKIFSLIPGLNIERSTILGLDPIIDLTIGQPHLPVNTHVISGLQKKLQESDIYSKFGYSQVGGRVETLNAILALYKIYYPKISYTIKEVMCTNGANQAIWNALSILVEEKQRKKDVVLTFEPYFGNYSSQVMSLGGELVKIPTGADNFYPTAAALAKTLRQYPNAKVLLLNFPNNPSGVNPAHELEKIVTVLNNYKNIAIILDEVYRELNYSCYTSLLDIAPELKQRTVVVNSGSKGLLGAPDMRVGMAAGPADWIEAMGRQQLLTTASVSYLSQIALTSAINAKIHGHTSRYEEYKANTDHMLLHLKDIGLSAKLNPQGGFFVLADASSLIGIVVPDEIIVTKRNGEFIKLKNIQEKVGAKYLRSDIDIATLFLHVAGVATVPGSGFGIVPQAGLLRISCAIDKSSLILAMNRLKEVCVKLSTQPKVSILNQDILPFNTTLPKKNIAIIGMGNIGEWFSYMLLTDLLAGNLLNIGKISYIGRNKNKLEAKIADQLHAIIISSRYEHNVTGVSTENIDQLMAKISYTEDYTVLGDVDYIITAFGTVMTPDIKERSDILLSNDRIATDIAGKIKNYANKNALLINIANPLDIMTWRLQELTNFPTDQVVGVSGTLDISRLAQAIHEVLKIKYQHINFNSLFVLGQHGPTMVPLLSQIEIFGRKLVEIANEDQINSIISFTKTKGTQIMESLGKVPPHIGTARATLVLLRFILNGDSGWVPCSAWNEDYQIYMGSIISFENNRAVIKSIDMSKAEHEALTKSAMQIKKEKESIPLLYEKIVAKQTEHCRIFKPALSVEEGYRKTNNLLSKL